MTDGQTVGAKTVEALKQVLGGRRVYCPRCGDQYTEGEEHVCPPPEADEESLEARVDALEKRQADLERAISRLQSPDGPPPPGLDLMRFR